MVVFLSNRVKPFKQNVCLCAHNESLLSSLFSKCSFSRKKIQFQKEIAGTQDHIGALKR